MSSAEQVMLENKNNTEHFKIKTTYIGFYRNYKAFVSLDLMSQKAAEPEIQIKAESNWILLLF